MPASQTDTAPGKAKRPDGLELPPPPDPGKIAEVTPPPAVDTPPESPPKRGPGRPKGSPNKPKNDAAPKRPVGRPPAMNLGKKVAETVEALATAMAGAALVSGSPTMAYDAAVLLERAGDIGEMMAQLARENPGIQRTLERMFTVSGWGKVSLTLASVVLPIAANHGVMPSMVAAPFFPKVGPPPERPAPKAKAAPVQATQRVASNGSTPPPAPNPAPSEPSPISRLDLPGWPADWDPENPPGATP